MNKKNKTIMKKLLLIICVIFCIGTTKAQGTKALFIGNSYTGVNNLPLLVQNVALSLGDTLYSRILRTL